MEINFDIHCPHCAALLPKKIDKIEIKDTEQLIGVACPNCAFVLSKNDIAMIDQAIIREREAFESNVVDRLFQDGKFTTKKS